MKTSLLLSKINYFIIAVLLFSSFTLYAQPKREFRATWLTTVWAIDWPKTSGSTNQIAELKQKIATLKNANLNATCFQVRSMCDAMYNSAYEPWSKVLTGTRGGNPGYDPLAVAITEAHNLGIELHAWLNPYRYESTAGTNGNMDIRKNHPDWLLTYSGGSVILDPGNPEVVTYIANIVKDILLKYDVDGIIFDDYFYDYEGTPSSLDATSQAKYKPAGMSLSDWRRSNVNSMVAAVYNVIQSTKPWVRFGVSPFGIWTTDASVAAAHQLTLPSGITGGNMYEQIYCDPVAWMEAGTVDYISPQLYWPTTSSGQDYDKLCPWWSNTTKTLYERRSDGKKIHFYSSMTRSSTTNSESNLQVERTRVSDVIGAPGHIFYNTTNFLANNYPAELVASSGKFYRKALPPAIDWKNHAQLLTPTNVTASGTSLTWQYGGTTWTTFNGYTSKSVRFAIYRYPKDTNSEDAMANSANLLGVSYITSFTLPSTYDNNYTYAVRSMDRYGNEFGAGYFSQDDSYVIPDETVSFNTTAVWTETAGGSSYVAKDNSQRSIAVWKGTLFIPSTNGTISLVNAKTGVLRRTLTLSGIPSQYLLFCLRITDEGEVLVGNSNLETTKLYIYRCDTITGNCTLFQEITTGTTNSRFDYFDVYGNLTQGMLVAASNNGYTLTAPIANGDIIGANVVTYSGSHNGGVSTTAIKRDDNSFFVAGFSTNAHKKYTIVDASTLSTISFRSVGPSTTLASVGGCCFRFKGHEFYAAAESGFGAFKVFDISAGVDDAYLIGDVTTALGSTANGIYVTPLCVELCDSDNEAWIYVLAPNNGIAAYKLSITNSPVQTLPVQNITSTGATFNGRTSSSTSLLNEVGFEYKKLGDSEYTQVTATKSATFSNVVNTLEPNTYYLVRAYIKTTGGNYKYGEVVKFKTLVTPPTVTTGTPTDLTTSSAILHGTVSEGTLNIIATGFEWKAAGGTYTKQPVTPSGSTLTHTLTGLTLGTTYYVRAYATTPQGDTYGNEITFSTLSIIPPTVTTSAATAIGKNSATLNGTIMNGSYAIIAYGFEYKKTDSLNYTSISGTKSGTTLTATINSLAHNTNYTFRAYATTAEEGTTYGTELTFKTLYNQLIIESGDTVAISTPFNGDLVFYHGGQIGNTTDTIIQIEGKIEYKRKFTRNLWYTIIFPFDVTKVTYGKNQEILPYRNGSGKFLLKQHNDNTSMNFIERWEDTPTPPAGIIIAKNVPYIIQVQSLVLNNREITFHSANSTHSIGNKTFVLYDNGNTTAFNYFGNNTLRPQTIGTCYIIEDQLFRRQDGTTSVPAFECYVQATPTVMKSMPYIGIMKEAGGTTETANTLYPYTLQTWSDNANVYIRSTVDQDIAIYNINGACLRKISLEKGETVSLQLPNAIYLLIGSQCEKPFKIVF